MGDDKGASSGRDMPHDTSPAGGAPGAGFVFFETSSDGPAPIKWKCLKGRGGEGGHGVLGTRAPHPLRRPKTTAGVGGRV